MLTHYPPMPDPPSAAVAVENLLLLQVSLRSEVAQAEEAASGHRALAIGHSGVDVIAVDGDAALLQVVVVRPTRNDPLMHSLQVGEREGQSEEAPRMRIYRGEHMVLVDHVVAEHGGEGIQVVRRITHHSVDSLVLKNEIATQTME